MNILQYYVHKKKSDMISLFSKLILKKYDVIVIQKSWQNFKIATSLNLMRNDFHLIYKLNANMKMYFYVNENIDLNKWKIEFPSANICTLKMRFWSKNELKRVHIHNVYNFSSMLYASIENLFTLSLIKSQLQTDVKHVYLKNFNLHHSNWNDSTHCIQHVAADQLLNIVMKKNLNFTLSEKTILW